MMKRVLLSCLGAALLAGCAPESSDSHVASELLSVGNDRPLYKRVVYY